MLMENGISLSTSEYDHIFILCLSVVLLHAKKVSGREGSEEGREKRASNNGTSLAAYPTVLATMRVRANA
jgi:hypothetical protein